MPRRLSPSRCWRIAVVGLLPIVIVSATPQLRRPIAHAISGLLGIEPAHHVVYQFEAPPNDTVGELLVTYVNRDGQTVTFSVPSFTADWHKELITRPGQQALRLTVTAATDLPDGLQIRCWIELDGSTVASMSGLPCDLRWP